MMKGTLISVALILLTTQASATTVNVSLDKHEFRVGERVRIHLEIHPTEKVGGQLNIFKIKEDKHRTLVRQPFRKPTPDQCYSCARDVPLSSDFSDYFYFTPEDEGTYNVEANFGGLVDHKNFTVGSKKATATSTIAPTLTTTSTTPPTPTTTPTTPTTSSSTAPATTIQATTPTTLPETTTTLNVAKLEKPHAKEKDRPWVYGVVFLFVVAAAATIIAALAYFTRKK